MKHEIVHYKIIHAIVYSRCVYRRSEGPGVGAGGVSRHGRRGTADGATDASSENPVSTIQSAQMYDEDMNVC